MVFDYLVVDSGAVILKHLTNAHHLANKLVTIQEVLDEIRDENARLYLASLVNPIEVRRPSSESMKAVVEFAKKTGDYSVLSVTDMKLIALTHSLEIEVNGEKNLRKPGEVTSIQNQQLKSKADKSQSKNEVVANIPEEFDTQSTPCDCHLIDEEVVVDEKVEVVLSSYEGDDEPDQESLEITEAVENLTLTTAVKESKQVIHKDINTTMPEITVRNEGTHSGTVISRILSAGSGTNASDFIREQDDGENWITVNNLSQNLGTNMSRSKTRDYGVQDVKVACMTGDFAMQNVMMQMGLQIAAFDGKLIRQVKQWVLRCNGCRQIHYDMTRLFCSKCGLSSLSKIGAHIDAKTGELKLHLKKNYQVSLKGTKYAIPNADQSIHGRFEGDILLREDQLLSGIWRQKSRKVRKNVSSAFGEDITGDVGLNINQSCRINVGFGKKNPNAMKGRERRGKGK